MSARQICSSCGQDLIVNENVSASLAAQVVQLQEERAELLELLTESQNHLKHTRCIEENALYCPACSIESRIEMLLAKVLA